MLRTLERGVHDLWVFWSGLFEPLPYGDPYLAIVSLLLIIGIAFKLMFSAPSTDIPT